MRIHSITLTSTTSRLAVRISLAALFTLLLSVYLRKSVPGADSAVFVYCGEQLLSGLAPYEGCWDHKPPLIHYLNAFGLWFANGALWGVWIVQWGLGLLAVMACYQLLQQIFSAGVAWFCTALFLVELIAVLQGGNLTEQYALTFQFGALWCFMRYGQSSSSQIRWLLLAGILGGCAFLLRQNLVALWLAFGLVSLGRHACTGRFALFFKEVGSMTVGVGLLLGSAAIFLGSQGALEETWTAAFAYNFANAIPGLSARLRSLVAGLNNLSSTPIAVAGWFVAAYMTVSKANRPARGSQGMVLLVVLVAFPLELLLTSISGRTYPHYFMAWLPSLTVLTALSVKTIYQGWISTASPVEQPKRRLLACVIGSFLWCVFAMQQAPILSKTWQAPGLQNERAIMEVVRFLDREGSKDDRLLVWGNFVAFNLLSGYPSPTRFVYQYPLFLDGVIASDSAVEFSGQILQSPPQWIIDASNGISMPSLGVDACSEWFGTASHAVCTTLESFFELIETRYRAVHSVGDWRIYRLDPSMEGGHSVDRIRPEQ